MLEEIKLLLDSLPVETEFSQFREAIVENNVLLKQTHSTRIESVRRLRELYSLDRNNILFRALLDLWNSEVEAQPVLALLTTLARDPVLRTTVDLIHKTPFGTKMDANMFSEAVKQAFPQLNHTTLANFGRHIASSWTQSGHLHGRTSKIRSQVRPSSSSCALALFLGYLCGERGESLFHTPWANVLDTPTYSLHNHAKAAAQYGWLEYRQSGSITDISFRHLLRGKGESIL